ncbi:MAG: pilus assembly protein N-terminal domain-containing protein [Alphaproteobacteria bacterium]|nr:pilus assembly protein N-terminal domain-containing protein [Alphaproteobacteria bacterium]
MKKKLSVICFAFLGLMNTSSVLADGSTNQIQNLGVVGEGSYDGAQVRINEKSGNKNLSNGIMSNEFVRNISNQKNEEVKNDNKRAQRIEKEIDKGSIHFLKFDREMDEVFIPNPDVLDVNLLSKKSLYYNGLEIGKTSLIIRDEEGKTLCDYLVKVTYPLGDIRRAIAKIFPDLEIDIVSIDSNLILKGNVASPEMAQDVLDIVERFVVNKDKIINKLTIETATQVMLKVKIAEVTRSVTKSLGIDWRTLSVPGGESSGLIGMAAGNNTLELPTSTDGVIDTLTTANIGAGEGGGKWIVAAGLNNLAALIDAAAAESFATILAEPNLVALSGKPATFKSGGQYGYVVNQNGTSDNKTTEFKDWGTSLEFTPVVLSEDRINIKVKTEVSSIEPKEDPDAPPNTAAKNVETVVELGSGQSIVLAGLLQKTNGNASVETPFLSEIPLIGSLFKSSYEKNEERELVIVVTPYIVKPSSKQLKVPTDMIPKMLSPLKTITKRRFHRLKKEADSAGFSLK